MKTERFKAILLEGHKDPAVEVPFDPATRWTVPTTRLGPGRHGHRVHGRLNGLEFESVVVPRGGAFFLIVPEELKAAAQLAPGDVAQLVLHPQSAAGGSLPSPVTRNSGRRSARRPTSTS
jgi:Domain of unknown function (DUF1905)